MNDERGKGERGGNEPVRRAPGGGDPAGDALSALLAELAPGDASAAELRAAWRASAHAGGDPERDREVEELCLLREELERSGAAARGLLAEAAGADEHADDAGVRRFFEERLGAPQAPPPALGGRPRRSAAARRWSLLALAASAAAVALLWVGLRSGDGGPAGADTDLRLGPGRLELLEPLGAVDAWGAFRWSAVVGSNAWFSLSVRDGEGRVLASVEDLQETTWRPGPLARDWPRRITWRLRAFDADGELGTWSAEAWLR